MIFWAFMKRIKKIFQNLRRVICDNSIVHFSYIPFGLGVFLAGFNNDNDKNKIIKIYADNFYNNFKDLSSLTIYASNWPST